MNTLMEKSRFLRLDFQTLAGDAVDRGRLATAEAEVQRLRRELEVEALTS